MKEKKSKEKMAVLSIRIPVFQKEWLEVHQEISGNKIPDVLRTLIDYYITLDATQGETK
jgi:hypothetical protein